MKKIPKFREIFLSSYSGYCQNPEDEKNLLRLSFVLLLRNFSKLNEIDSKRIGKGRKDGGRKI